MSDWFKWDDPTPEERERDLRIDVINNAGGRAMAGIRQIEEAVRDDALVEAAGIGELRKLHTVLGATLNSLNRLSVDRSVQRQKERA